ncbi:hypothetical protein E1B28_005778 [Marasmius oreades]|uniref:DUF6699 domain-containing protein n=1 Tax=Marasmius oreades TaxID=181124 RepID=A0A9P7UVW4_9AGAR|nr:uncharacterized protein E1B28_005778 [Marasmius oreades]KAG7094981.1 hypothetical protein E1B28_005778 [Marasmius oreades]
MITKLHYLLEYQPFAMESRGGFCYTLFWDIRNPPLSSARCIYPHHHSLTHEEFSTPATQPPVTRLQISCGVFPHDWPIHVHNRHGVTVKDVLEAIYNCLQTQYTSDEFNTLCQKQRSRIMDVFNARVQVSHHPRQTWDKGMKRIDCLLQHSFFGGLSIAPSIRTGNNGPIMDGCILSLRRAHQPQFSAAHLIPASLH